MHPHPKPSDNVIACAADGFFAALVGSPNSGKTTLYNRLTESSHATVNYPGSTVDYSYGIVSESLCKETFILLDTPGSYSLFPKSPDEKVTTDIIYHYPTCGYAKVVVATVDLSQLSRQLWIVYQLLEAKFQVIVALTMKDMFATSISPQDRSKLEEILGCPVVFVSGRTGEGISELLEKVQAARKTIPQAPKELTTWTDEHKQKVHIKTKEVERILIQGNRSFEDRKTLLQNRTRRIDRFLLHPFFGLVVFFIVMFGFFSSIFWLATPFMDLVDGLFQAAGSYVLKTFPGSLWSDFLSNGVILSLGAVFVFVPQIAILFLGITVLEDTGYLSRACSLIDKPLSKLGLNGRSFVPLLSGNACAIPAMMAARTISSPKEKFLTLFIIPLMSCSARLPVYALLLSFLFWGQPAWKAGLALSAIYFLSLVVGALAAGIGNYFIRFSQTSFFIHELPMYRRPHVRVILRSVFEKTMAYVRRAGPIIFILAVVVWVLTTFPNYDAASDSEKLDTSYAATIGKVFEPIMYPMGGDWRTGTALISAFAAREVFVSSLSLVLHLSEVEEEGLQDALVLRMKEAVLPDGSPLFTVSSAVGLILFFMVALQCMSTVAIARREFGDWKVPLIQLFLFNVVAYVLAVGAVQTLRAIGIS